jgi:hypothetical protein
MQFLRWFCLVFIPYNLLFADVVFRYRALGDRNEVLSLLRSNPKNRVLDVGYSANTWSSEFVTHYIDINPISDHSKISFKGDINFPQVWEAIEKDVLKNGLFEYCICSHTLEDIVNPAYVASMINRFCKSGFIAVPSKFTEMKPIEGSYRGYIHHRYIYNFENGKLVGYPKLNFIEYDRRFDSLANQLRAENAELQIFWDNNFELKIINDNYMGPDIHSVLSYYNSLLLNH